jgi:hypothetical protein
LRFPLGEGQTQKLDDKTVGEVSDALRAAKKGTGFFANVRAVVDGVLGGLVSSENISEYFRDTQDARQALKIIRVLGRSALATSPKFAVADLQLTEQLFPNEKTFFTNPETEARKFLALKDTLIGEKRRLLTLLQGSIDSGQRSTANGKIVEIDRLLDLLGPIGEKTGGMSESDANELKDIIKRGRGR